MAAEQAKISFKDTLNLPRTDFPMRAGLVKKEPEILKKWAEQDIYHALLEKNKNNEHFILHDGPPYPNGNIHLGHALNKILKDIIVRYNLLQGKYSPFIPGWDCHGLPIETQLLKELQKHKKKIKDKAEFRNECKKYALNYVEKQREQFTRLGVLGEWAKPYLTLDYGYEAKVVEVFAECAQKGYVYKGQKPIHWCSTCKTALAEAEIEYEEHSSPSVYVKFKVEGTQLLHKDFAEIKKQEVHPLFGSAEKEACFIVWTTTPWTLPANVAVAVHPDYIYAVIKDKKTSIIYIVAESLLEKVASACELEYSLQGKLKGSDLDGMVLRHPFVDRESPVVLAEYVTADDGTGCVHIAPGHGQEDHVVGQKYDLPTIMPVDDSGKFTEEAGEFAGKDVFKANKDIIKKMEKLNVLLKSVTVKHSYPHCWRCHKPVIFRATPQWFIAVDQKPSIREKALSEIKKTKWIPAWGEKRITGMIANRPDWCISRQRSWGIPIPIMYCKKCEKPQLTKQVFDLIIKAIRENGSNVWFEKSAKEILGDGISCECGSDQFEKETDIMDVWLESGASFAAVCQNHDQLSFPAGLYLEGSDQHRGWFHSSLLLSVAVEERAPYKAVLTHGFTVDEKGRKQSKSLGNTIDPLKVIQNSGADILRLWVASADFKNDLALSPAILKQVTDSFSKIRNTWRFLLSNLYDFDIGKHHDAPLQEIDQWMMSKLQSLIKNITVYYDNYEFHKVYHAVYDFCVNNLSALYLDIHKDNLYCNTANDPKRRSAQYVLKQLLDTMVRLMAPILVFTAEDLWSYFSKDSSVHFMDFPKVNDKYINPDLESSYENVLAMREDVNLKLEILRKEKKEITSSLEAEVEIICKDPENYDSKKLAAFFIVSKVTIKKGDKPETRVFKSNKQKCARCWKFAEIKDYLCPRCQKVVSP